MLEKSWKWRFPENRVCRGSWLLVFHFKGEPTPDSVTYMSGLDDQILPKHWRELYDDFSSISPREHLNLESLKEWTKWHGTLFLKRFIGIGTYTSVDYRKLRFESRGAEFYVPRWFSSGGRKFTFHNPDSHAYSRSLLHLSPFYACHLFAPHYISFS